MSSNLPGPSEELFKGELAMWRDGDTRASLEGVHEDPCCDLRVEAVDIDGVYKFFNFASSRRLTDKVGRSLALVCQNVRLRVLAADSDAH
eukprot:8907039-Alexandrium_andersonii.AAC.1